LRVGGVGSLFHHGSYYTFTYDRCGHTATVEASRRELEQTVKTHYASCQLCARPFRWVCPGCALVLSSSTVTAEEDPATGRQVVRCSNCGADAWS
jgi:transcription elongation factor Elf1